MAVIESSAYLTQQGQTRGTFGPGRLKDEYWEKLDDHVHTGRMIPSIIATKRGTMGGRRSLTSVMSDYPQSAGIALFEGYRVPTPRVGTYFNPELISRDLYMYLEWTGHVERAARKGSSVAWAAPRKEDMKTARIQFEINFCRMLYLGPFQVLGTVSAWAGGPFQATLYGRDQRSSAANNLWKFGSHYLRRNMSVAFVPNNGGNVNAPGSIADNDVGGTAEERFITAIDTSGASPVVTLNAAPTTAPANNSIILPYASRRPSTGGAAVDADFISRFAGVNGLMQLATDANIYSFLFGLSRSTFPTLQGKRFRDAGGVNRVWNEDYISVAADTVNDEGTGDDPECLLMHRSLRREYIAESKGDRRFKEVQTQKGWGELHFHAGDVLLPVKTDRDCPPGLVFVLDGSTFGWYEESPFGSPDQGERFVPNQDARAQLSHKSGNGMTDKPHNSGTVEDISHALSDLPVIG